MWLPKWLKRLTPSHPSACTRTPPPQKIRDVIAQTRREILSRIGVELLGPMHGIHGLSEMVLDTDLTNHQQECLQAIQELNDRLLRELGQILQFTCHERKTTTESKRPFDPVRLLEDAITSLRPAASRKDLSLQLDYPPDIPRTVVGDPLHYRQVLLALLDNAVRYTDSGMVKVVVESVRVRNQELALETAVCDTGRGIAPEDQQHIFHAFEQAGCQCRPWAEGIGLGLAIAEYLTRQMGGTLRLSSETGKGSVFRFNAHFTLLQPQDMTPIQSVADPQASPDSCQDIFDRHRVMDRLEHDEHLYARLVGMVQSQGPSMLEAIRTALQRRDNIALQNAAQVAREMAMNFYASDMTAAAQELMNIGRWDHWNQAEAALANLEHQLDRLLQALRDSLTENGPDHS